MSIITEYWPVCYEGKAPASEFGFLFAVFGPAAEKKKQQFK